MHGHLGEVNRHLFDKVVLDFWVTLICGHLVVGIFLGSCVGRESRLLLLLRLSPTLNLDSEHLQEVDFQEV